MKTLLLIRHAKSSWKNPSLSDLQRPLKKRGIDNARDMAGRLQELDVNIEKVLCSPANRATETLEVMTGVLTGWQGKSEILTELYSFDYDEMMLVLRKLDDRWLSVAVVGHNPAVTDLVNFLALENLRNIPTCGVGLLRLDIDHWREMGAGCGRLDHYDFPNSDSCQSAAS